jgi:hypothetical protein
MQVRRSSRVVRICVVVLALQAGVVGVWALFGPEQFFSDFPGFGRAWVGALGPYNEHLVRDVGGLYVGWMVLFSWVAVTLDRVVLKIVMLAWLPFAIAHLIFHLSAAGRLDGSDQVLSITGLAIAVVLPIIVLSRIRRRTGSDFTWSRNV